MKVSAAQLLLLLGLLCIAIAVTSVESKRCKGRGCSKNRDHKTRLGRARERKAKNRKPVAPYWKKGKKKGPPKSVYVVREGRDLILSCAIKGRPMPTFTWLINGKAVIPNSKKISQRRHRLVIKKLQMEDTGKYTCIANNSLGQLNITHTVRVLENKPHHDIQVVEQPKNQTCQVGDTAIFRCRSHDWPSPDVYWARRPLSTGIIHVVKMSDNSTDSTVLILHNVTKKDAGEYICFISNEKTSKQLSATLTVIDESESLPFEPPCSLHVRRQVLSDQTQTCWTDQPVDMHYCMGSCGRSYFIPELIVTGENSQFPLNQTCKCCVGVVEMLKIVELRCPLGLTKRGFYPKLRECRCQMCSADEKSLSQANGTVSSKPLGRK